ncbi:MAG: HGxxPAAW family protein [Actinomycetota bacterium]
MTGTTQEGKPMSVNNHGKTPAAWATTFIVIIGSIVAGVAIAVANIPWAIAGFAIVALGGVVGLVMKAAGLGRKQTSH